jgi:hypothetical protein
MNSQLNSEKDREFFYSYDDVARFGGEAYQ